MPIQDYKSDLETLRLKFYKFNEQFVYNFSFLAFSKLRSLSIINSESYYRFHLDNLTQL